jgi:hypothetical protein
MLFVAVHESGHVQVFPSGSLALNKINGNQKNFPGKAQHFSAETIERTV